MRIAQTTEGRVPILGLIEACTHVELGWQCGPDTRVEEVYQFAYEYAIREATVDAPPAPTVAGAADNRAPDDRDPGGSWDGRALDEPDPGDIGTPPPYDDSDGPLDPPSGGDSGGFDGADVGDD